MNTIALKAARNVTELLQGLLGGPGDRALARRGALTAFAIRIASAAIVFFSQVLLVRWMGGHEYGLFAYAWVWITILGIAVPIGLNTSVLRFLPQYERRRELDLLRGLLFTSRTVTFAAATAIALVGAATVWLTGGIVAAEYAVPLYLALICLPMFALIDIQEGIARAFSWVNIALMPQYLVRPTLMLVLLGGAMLAGVEPSAETAITCAIGATWATALGQYLVLRRHLSERVPSGPSATRTGHWIVVSLPILMVSSFFVVLANTDVLVLNIYVEPGEAAMYYAAVKTTTLISFVYYAVTTAYAHRFAEYNAAGDRDGLAAVLREAVVWTFWPSLAASLGILALGWPLLWLFSPEFTAAYPVMFVLVVGLLARAAVGPIEYTLSMLGEEKSCAAALAFTALANVGLNFLLIPDFGLMGAAAATTISTILATVLLALLAQRRLGLKTSVWTRAG